MEIPQYGARREQLISRLEAAGVDALLVASEVNVAYLTGFTGDSTALLIGRDLQLMISDTRYGEQIQRECRGLDMEIREASVTKNSHLVTTIRACQLNRVGFESDTIVYSQWEALSSELLTINLVPTSGIVESIRKIKDKWELIEIRQAVEFAQRGLGLMRDTLRKEQTEIEAANQLEMLMRGLGASGRAFDTIIAAGSNSALPHARPSRRLIGEADFVLVDWGAQVPSGYRSDLTRVIPLRPPSEQFLRVHHIVLQAQQAAISQIRPGAACQDVDHVARALIEEAGYGNRFGHGLGHSFGLEIHESPRLSPVSSDVLEAGMVITVEPGIYLPGWGGIRIEDDVLVTEDGCEVLSNVTRKPEELMVGQ